MHFEEKEREQKLLTTLASQYERLYNKNYPTVQKEMHSSAPTERLKPDVAESNPLNSRESNSGRLHGKQTFYH